MAELVSNSTIFLNTDSVEEREKSLKKRMLFALKCNKYLTKTCYTEVWVSGSQKKNLLMLLWYSLKDSTTCKSLLYVVFLQKIWSCLALLYNLMVFCDNTVQYLLNDTVKCYLDIKLYKGDSQHISCLIIVDIDSNISLLYTVRDNTEHYHCTLLSPDNTVNYYCPVLVSSC